MSTALKTVNGMGPDETGNINVAAAPIGAVYVQYAGKKAPAEIYGGIWTNISAQYAGRFFRTEGGAAAAFGQAQGDGAPNIIGTLSPNTWQGGIVACAGAFSRGGDGQYLSGIDGGQNWQGVAFNFSAYNSNNKYALNEVRPLNSTIRIWERTG